MHADQRRWLALADGRRLAYTETGPAEGQPVLYCPGAIGTPLSSCGELRSITDDLGIRHLALSRPGTGGSDRVPGRTLPGFAADVRALADALELERLDLVGVSAGGPYALAVAHRLPERVGRVALCSSLSPTWALRHSLAIPGRIRLKLRSDERAAAGAALLAAAKGGVRGMIEDFRLYTGEWGFDVAEVQATVQLWHGCRDSLVPVEHALQLAIALPDCRVFLDPDEGHHFFRSRLRAILTALRDAGPDAGVGPAAALETFAAR